MRKSQRSLPVIVEMPCSTGLKLATAAATPAPECSHSSTPAGSDAGHACGGAVNSVRGAPLERGSPRAGPHGTWAEG